MTTFKENTTLPDALIGYSGFVGSNILRQSSFKFLYNSRNIEEIREQSKFNTVVCAAPASVKWYANTYPKKDLTSTERLINIIESIKTNKFILISTIDVYPIPKAVNEDSKIIKKDLLPYSLHRRLLEEFIINHFDSLIVRLPALFGPGIKKNTIYDLIHHNYDYTPPESIMQYYNLDHLWEDIKKALFHNLNCLNISPEPIETREIADKVFGKTICANSKTKPSYYDMHSKYAVLWGNKGHYLYTKKEVLMELNNFVNNPATTSSH